MIKLLRRIKHTVRIKPGVYAAAVALILGGLAVPDPTLAFISYVVAAGLLLWGTTIHGWRTWEVRSWLHGPMLPHINASLMDFPYVKDTVISGIKWEPGYSHVHLSIANRTADPIGDINFVIFLDKPIIKSACRSPFAQCAIGVATRMMGQVTVLGTDKDGNEIAIAGDEDNRIELGPPHRLVCASLPSGTEIEIDLATVLPLPPEVGLTMWDHTKRDPTWIGVDGRITIRGEQYPLMWRQFVGKAAP
jgi:hypothetical protein